MCILCIHSTLWLYKTWRRYSGVLKTIWSTFCSIICLFEVCSKWYRQIVGRFNLYHLLDLYTLRFNYLIIRYETVILTTRPRFERKTCVLKGRDNINIYFLVDDDDDHFYEMRWNILVWLSKENFNMRLNIMAAGFLTVWM